MAAPGLVFRSAWVSDDWIGNRRPEGLKDLYILGSGVPCFDFCSDRFFNKTIVK